ncbi:hypothetical protein [Serratia marcescens]|uniref:hypothetical protein n=1 Tax=Serratia marcescens TaxID=615 RepID=UPI00301B89A0
MKSTITKNVTGLLVLASAALPFVSQAAEQSATVNITATVDATVALDVAKSFDLKNLTTVQDLDIKTTSNGTKVKLEVSQSDAADDYIVLTSERADKAKMNVKATLGDSNSKFDKGVLSVEVPSSTTQQTTKLHLTAQPKAAQEAGKYSGTITVKASTL